MGKGKKPMLAKRTISQECSSPDKKGKMKAVTLWLFALISAIAAAVGVAEIFFFPNKTSFEWMDVDHAIWKLSNSNIYYDDYVNTLSKEYYPVAAALLFTYNNYGINERVINEITVTATNIKEDYSPVLMSDYIMRDQKEVYATLYNYGWGDTGPIQIVYLGYDLTAGTPDIKVDISFPNIELGPWNLSTVPSGKSVDQLLFCSDDIHVDSPVVENGTCILLHFRVTDIDTDDYSDFDVRVEYNNEEWIIDDNASGGPITTAVGFKVDTSSGSYTKTVPTTKFFRGHEATVVPIYISPSMSCTMTLDVSFKTQDGKVIHADSLENAYFFVACIDGDNPTFIDAESINWDTYDPEPLNNDGNFQVVSFPYDSD